MTEQEKQQKKEQLLREMCDDLKHFPTLDELPDQLMAKDIAAHMRVSERRVYEHFRLSPDHGGIPNYRFGKTILVEKSDFVMWKEARKREQAARFVR